MAKIDFSKIEDILDSSSNITLTEKQYKTLTGRNLPKDTSYLVRRSALSRLVKSKGLKIVVHEKSITFEKMGDAANE